MTARLPVSLCMIVKNEEHCIASCIASVRHLVQEIVVVDTGSTDRTREVAAAGGARVYDFVWCDDFAAARNYSLEQATGEWILVLDADEMLEAVKPEDFAGLLRAEGVEGYFVTVRSYLGTGCEAAEDLVVRLFRNKPDYRFEGVIHEQVAGSIKRHNNGGGLACSGLILHHTGYLSREIGSKDKRRRNIRVIRKALAARPTDPFLLYSLGIEYLQADQADQGIRCLEKALSLMDGCEGYFHDLLVTLGLGLLKSGCTDKLAGMLEKALSMYRDDPDLALLKGMLHFSEGSYEQAAAELRRGLNKGRQILLSSQILSLLGDACNHLGLYSEAAMEYYEALKLSPGQLYPLTRLLGLIQSGRINIDWGCLSGFASMAVKRYLRDKLFELGELPLSVVVSLLTVVDAAGMSSNEVLFVVCREHQAAVQSCKENQTGEEPLWDYLLVSAGEISLCAEAWQRWPSTVMFSPLSRVLELATDSLEVAVKVLGPCRLPSSNLP